MAREKDKSPEKEAGQPRKKKTTADDLAGVAERLRSFAESIDAQAEKMRQEKIAAIEIEGHQMLDRAFSSINVFLGNCIGKITQH